MIGNTDGLIGQVRSGTHQKLYPTNTLNAFWVFGIDPENSREFSRSFK